MSSEDTRKLVSVPSQCLDNLNAAESGSDTNRTSLSFAPASFGALNASFLLGDDLDGDNSDDDSEYENELRSGNLPTSLGDGTEWSDDNPISETQSSSPSSIFSYSFASLAASSNSSSSSSSCSASSPTTSAPQLPNDNFRTLLRDELPSAAVDALIATSLSADPPALDELGWHPLSGSPAARQAAVNAFGLGEKLASSSPSERQRWYAGLGSPWKCALGPPHGGVAFGVPYGGAASLGAAAPDPSPRSDSSTAANSSHLYEGRWRITKSKVLEYPACKQVHSSASALASSLYLSKPTWLFSPNGAICEERVKLPLIGQIASTHWLVCVYVSPTMRLLRCIRGAPSPSSATSNNNEASSSRADNDESSLAFHYAIATLQSLTVRDATTGAEVTGSMQGIDRWIGKGELKPPRRPHSPAIIVDSSDQHHARRSVSELSGIPGPPLPLDTTSSTGPNDRWAKKPQPPPYSPSTISPDDQEPRLSFFCVPVPPRASPAPSNAPAPGGAVHASIMAVGAGGGKRRLRIEFQSIAGGRRAQVLDHAPPTPGARTVHHARGDARPEADVRTSALAEDESLRASSSSGDPSLRSTLSKVATVVSKGIAAPLEMAPEDTPAMALSPTPSDTTVAQSSLRHSHVNNPLDPTIAQPKSAAAASTASHFSWEASLALAINRQVVLLESGAKHSGDASGNRNSVVDRSSNSKKNSDIAGNINCNPVTESQLPLCAGCNSHIHLRSFEALGALWHITCLTCVHCAKPLGAGERFYVDDDLATGSAAGSAVAATATARSASVHCADCYLEVTYTRCFGCLAHIVNEPAVAALGQTFHLRCFSCAACGQNMSTEKANSMRSNAKTFGSTNDGALSIGSVSETVHYFEHNGQVYCDADYQRLFGNTCSGCGLSLSKMLEAEHRSLGGNVTDSPSNVVEALEELWHRECFICAECSTPLDAARSPSATPSMSLSWGTVSGVMYCAEHFARRFAVESAVLEDWGKGGADEIRVEAWTGGHDDVRSGSLHRSSSQIRSPSFRLTLEQEPVRLSFNGGPPAPPMASIAAPLSSIMPPEEAGNVLPRLPSSTARQSKCGVVIPAFHVSGINHSANNTSDESSCNDHGEAHASTNEQFSRKARSPTFEQTIGELKHDWFLPADNAHSSNVREREIASASASLLAREGSPSSAQSPLSPSSIAPLDSSAQDSRRNGGTISTEGTAQEIAVRHGLLSAGIDWARESHDRGAQRAQCSWKRSKNKSFKPMNNVDIDAVPRTQDLKPMLEPSSAPHSLSSKSTLQPGKSTMDVAVTLRYGVAAALGQSVPQAELEPRLYVLRSATLPPADDPKNAAAAAEGLNILQPQDYTEVATYVLGTTPLASSGTDDADSSMLSGANIDAVQDLLPDEEVPLSFEALAPAVFKALRRRVFGMGDAEYFASMCKNTVSSVSAGSGKSGSYFMYSADRRLIIKSVKRSEFPFLMRILPSYVRHMKSNHFHSLLPRYLGLYKIKQPGQPAERLLVMNNILFVPPESLPEMSHSPTAPLEETTTNNEVKSDNEVKALQKAELDGLLRQANKCKLSKRDTDRVQMLMRVVTPTSTPRYVSFRDVAADTPENRNDVKNEVDPSEVSSKVPCVDSSRLPEHNSKPESSRHFTAAPPGLVNDVYFARTYDLKGSLLKRFVTDDDVANGETVYKDLNFCRCHDGTDNKGNAVPCAGKHCRKLSIGPERWPSFVASFLADVAWLRAHNIMDYSLLVGCALVNGEHKMAAPASPSSTAAKSGSEGAPTGAEIPIAKSVSSSSSSNQSPLHTPLDDATPAFSDTNASTQLRYRVAADDLKVIDDVPLNALRPLDIADGRNQDPTLSYKFNDDSDHGNRSRWAVGQRVIVDINGASCAATVESIRTFKLSSKGQMPPPLPPRRPRPKHQSLASPLYTSPLASSDIPGSAPKTTARNCFESESKVAPKERIWSHLTPSCYSEWVRDRGGVRARSYDEQEKNVVYYMGIIDILQEFNMTKRLESVYKQRLQTMAGKDPTLISAVDASVYSKRFVDFITSHVE